MDFNKIVRQNGSAIIMVILFIVLLAQFQDLTVVEEDSTANTAVTSGKTLLSTFLDYIEIIVVLAVFIYFLVRMNKKGKDGMGA